LAQPNPNGRFFVEGVVIVLSILLAFAIDAGWAERLERREEAEIILGLQEEFEEYREALVVGIAQHERMMAGMFVILESIGAGEWSSRELTIDEALGAAVEPPTADLGNGVRDALVQAGRLELVSDPVLRRQLAVWPRYFEELLDDQLIGRGIVLEEVLPYLASRGLPLSAIMANVYRGPWPVTSSAIADSPDLVAALLADDHFRALIEFRYGYWAHARGEYEAALEAVDAILANLN